MSQENVELARSIYAAWERGDFFTSAEWAHPEIEFVIADGPAPGSWTGLVGMAEGFRDFLNVWERYRIEAGEYRGRGGGLTQYCGVADEADLIAFCRPPPSEERQRDPIGAWLEAPSEACPLAIRLPATNPKGDQVIVVGVDPHKKTHTAVAVDSQL